MASKKNNNLNTSTLSASSLSLSEDISSDEDDDNQIRAILTEAITDCEVISNLPPTPAKHRQSPGAPSSVASSSPVKSYGGNGGKSLFSPSPSCSSSVSPEKTERKSKRRRATTRNLCAALGIQVDEAELEEINKDERTPVDFIIEDILSKGGLGRSKRKGKAGRSDDVDDDVEYLGKQYDKISKDLPLDVSAEGRCTVLKADVETVRKTKESIDALIQVLESTRIKLINEDPSLVFTEPPCKTREKKNHIF